MTPWVMNCPDLDGWCARLAPLIGPIQADGCIPWLGQTNSYGYGRFKWRDKDKSVHTTSAHRAIWLAVMGPIPYRHVPDHLCRNRLCVAVDHLEIVTVAENNRRGAGSGHALWNGTVHVTNKSPFGPGRNGGRKPSEAANFRCGHPKTDANTLLNRCGARHDRRYPRCRTCNRERTAINNARRRKQAA